MDPYTMEVRLCDDDGMVSDERVEPGSPGTVFDPDLTYRKLLNNLRARNRNSDHRSPYEGEPFHCTGSAHVAGEHVRCTSPAHDTRAITSSTAIAVLSPAGSVMPDRQVGRWTIHWSTQTGPDENRHAQISGPVVVESVPVVPCDDAAIAVAVEWATHAGVLPMREFVEGIIAALAGTPLGCPCVGTPDQEDCPHA